MLRYALNCFWLSAFLPRFERGSHCHHEDSSVPQPWLCRNPTMMSTRTSNMWSLQPTLWFKHLKLSGDTPAWSRLPKYLFTHAPRMQFHIDFIYFHNFANDHHPLLCSRGRMSFLGKIFGGKGGQDKPVTTGEAIQKLRETEDMLMKKQVFLEMPKIHRWGSI